MNSPSERLQELMRLENISQQDLADKLGNHNSLISKYLNPNHKPSDAFLRKVEDIMGWKANYIRTGSGPKRRARFIAPPDTEETIAAIELENMQEFSEQVAAIAIKLGLNPISILGNQARLEKLEKENETLSKELLAAKDEIIRLLKQNAGK